MPALRALLSCSAARRAQSAQAPHPAKHITGLAHAFPAAVQACRAGVGQAAPHVANSCMQVKSRQAQKQLTCLILCAMHAVRK